MRSRFPIYLVCLVVLAASLGCGSQNRYLSKGKELVKSDKRNREARAVEQFRQAIELEPDNAEAHYLLGYYDAEASLDQRGEHMYKAYQNDQGKYIEILVFETLRDREQDIREAALIALQQIHAAGESHKKRAFKELRKAITSKDSRDRHDAQWVFAELGKRASGAARTEIIDLLLGLIDHKRMGTRLEAVIALGEIGDESAVDPLVALVESGSAADKSDREDPEVRRLAIEALGKIGGSAVPHLIDVMQNKGSSLRVDAIEALTRLGDQSVLDQLIAVMGEQGSRQVEVTFRR